MPGVSRIPSLLNPMMILSQGLGPRDNKAYYASRRTGAKTSRVTSQKPGAARERVLGWKGQKGCIMAGDLPALCNSVDGSPAGRRRNDAGGARSASVFRACSCWHCCRVLPRAGQSRPWKLGLGRNIKGKPAEPPGLARRLQLQ
jgi:hypothetical protein